MSSLNDRVAFPIDDCWWFKWNDLADQYLIGGQLIETLMPLIPPVPADRRRFLRYKIKGRQALAAFRQLATIGDRVGEGQEFLHGEWLRFIKEYGLPVDSLGNDPTASIRLGADDLLSMPIAAAACLQLVHAINRSRYKSISSIATHGVTANGKPTVSFMNDVPIYLPVLSGGVVGIGKDTVGGVLYFQTKHDLKKAKDTDQVWGIAAREWIDNVVGYYSSSMSLTFKKGNLILGFNGLRSAMWFEFWRSLDPQPKKRICKDCGKPIETGRQCQDCKRLKHNEKMRRYYANLNGAYAKGKRK